MPAAKVERTNSMRKARSFKGRGSWLKEIWRYWVGSESGCWSGRVDRIGFGNIFLNNLILLVEMEESD